MFNLESADKIAAEECKLDIDTLNKLVKKIQDQQKDNPNMNQTLRSDAFYDDILALVKWIEDIDFMNYKCFIEKAPKDKADAMRDSLCKSINMDLVHVDNIIFILDKYQPLFKRVMKKMYSLLTTMQKYCNQNTEAAIKLRIITSKIGLMLVDDFYFYTTLIAGFIIVVLCVVLYLRSGTQVCIQPDIKIE